MSADRAIPAGGAELGRRTIILLLGVLVLGTPALILRLSCAGHSCDEPIKASATIPFCSLPKDLRTAVAAGFRDGRSPDVFGITTTPVAGGTAAPRVPWPSIATTETDVPLVFAGSSLAGPSLLPDGARLDQVAPTIAAAIELDRPHPEVRSGTALPLEITDRPTLVLEVILKGLGSEVVAGAGATPVLDGLIENGAATTHADPGSVPLDSAAVLTTIGTGGLPSQHGITGSLIRNDAGTLVRAWSESAPPSVIAGLGDDLDEIGDGAPRIGLVASRTDDRGLIGGRWYLGAPDDDDIVVTRDAAAAAKDLLTRGYGSDESTDLLGVVLTGSPITMDRALGEIVEAASEASKDRLLIVVTATGRAERTAGAVPWTRVSEDLDATIGAPVTEAVVPGGLFIDQAVIAREQITEREITNAFLKLEVSEDPVLADAFPAIAISFLRYC